MSEPSTPTSRARPACDDRLLPRVRPSLLSWAARCALRLHRELAGGAPRVVGPAANTRRRHALRSAVIAAVREAHERAEQGIALVQALSGWPAPADLLPEEQALFAEALAGYAAAVGHGPDTALAAVPAFPQERSATGRFVLSAAVDVAVRRSGGGVEVRTLAWEPARRPLPLDPRAQVTALLLRRHGPLAYRRIALLAGASSRWEVPAAAVRPLGRGLRQQVLAALDAPGPPTPGPWCAGCPFVRSCPAVSAVPAAALAPDAVPAPVAA